MALLENTKKPNEIDSADFDGGHAVMYGSTVVKAYSALREKSSNVVALYPRCAMATAACLTPSSQMGPT